MNSSSQSKLGVSDDPMGARVTLRDCLDAALKQSVHMSDKILSALVSNADKAFSKQVKPNFPPPVLAAVEQLLTRKDAIRLSFNQRLHEGVFQGLGADVQAPQMMRFEDLKLFEEEDLDESIETARALQEIGQAVDDVMPPLDALMSSLLGWITVQSQINPLRPEMYARALRGAIAEQISDSDIRGAILSPLSARLGLLLHKHYLDIAAWLKSCGVEAASVVQPGQVQSSVAKPSVVGSMGNSVARTLLTLDRLRRLLAGELDGDSGRKPQDFLHTVPASVVALQDMRQVEAMVKRLESKARTAAQNPDADAARKRAAARMALADGKHLGKQLGEEVVRLMLDNLIADERLLPQVRAHLQTVEPLLMDMAKADVRFFSDKQHAARQFLDKVTSRSLAFATERDDGYVSFVQSVEKSIESLSLKTQGGDTASQAFAEALRELEAVWARRDAQERIRREEAARALLHAEQRNMLAQFLGQEFRANADGADIPKVVVDFVCGPWAQAVAEAQLACTDGTNDPQGYQALVAELYWSVQRRLAKRNRRRLVQLIPGMLAKLRQGLQIIEFPPEHITDFFTQLIGMHEAALDSGRPKPAAVPVAGDTATAQPTTHEQTIEQAAEQDEAAMDRAELEALYAASRDMPLDGEAAPADFAPTQSPETAADKTSRVWMGKREAAEVGYVPEDAVRAPEAPARQDLVGQPGAASPTVGVAIAIGSWVELMLDDQWVRAQLTWASPHRTLYMFVVSGGKSHSMSQRTMDKMRAQDQLRLVSDGRLVDKALDAVAQTALQNSVDRT